MAINLTKYQRGIVNISEAYREPSQTPMIEGKSCLLFSQKEAPL